MTMTLVVIFALSSCILLTSLCIRRLLALPAPSTESQLRLLPADQIAHAQASTGSRPTQPSVFARLNHWISHVMSCFGSPISVGTMLLLTIVFAALVAFVTGLLGCSLLVQAFSAGLALLPGPLVLRFLWRRRQQQIQEQLPATLDLLAKAVQAGESFENAVAIASDSAKTPLKDELDLCVKRFEMGSPATAVMAAMVKRAPSMEMRIFAHTISVHRDVGGKLTEALERLSSIIRSRRESVQRIESLTSLGRFAIVVISLLGVFVLAYLATAHPDYLGKLLQSETGRSMILYGCISEVIGLAWVALTLHQDY